MKKWRTRDQPPTDPEQRAAQRFPQPKAAPKDTPPAPPRTGFKAALRALKDRKLSELADTAKWRKRSKAEREAEAKARADREMARRIERQTGKKPAASTLQRNAAKDTAPRGVDQARLDRQAAVDRAGGLKEFAEQAKVSQSKARRWLATGTVPIYAPAALTGPITIFFTIVCDLLHTSTDPRKKKVPSPQLDKTLTAGVGGATGMSPLQLSGDDAEDFLRLVSDGDQQALKDKLGELLEMYELNSHDWGSASTTCTVKEIIDITIAD